jgi:electron transport complex protein RnfD
MSDAATPGSTSLPVASNPSTLPPGEPEYLVSASPHLAAGASTQRIMYEVLLAMVPLMVMSLWLWGFAAITLTLSSTLGCLFAEYVANAWRGRSQASLMDGSAIVTGVILAFSLPPSMAAGSRLYMAFIGGAVGIALGKAVFGGIGQNLFNPAMVGRAFLMLCFPAALGDWSVVPNAISTPEGVDAVTMATPLLASAKGYADQLPAIGSLFLGNVKGALGETSALAAIIGGIYLIARGIADWRLTVSTLVSVAVFALVYGTFDADQGAWATVGVHLTSGSLMFAAFFIVTEYCGAPLNPAGRLIFGASVGIVTMLIRLFGAYPEGVMFAVLIMNAFTPAIERLTTPTPLGGHAKA